MRLYFIAFAWSSNICQMGAHYAGLLSERAMVNNVSIWRHTVARVEDLPVESKTGWNLNVWIKLSLNFYIPIIRD
jgi:hypothetical protein